MSEEGYYCSKCRRFVIPRPGQFQHPDLGIKTAYLCPICGTHVYVKKKEEQNEIEHEGKRYKLSGGTIRSYWIGWIPVRHI